MAVSLDELNQKLADAKAAVDALVAVVQSSTVDFQAEADQADAITAAAVAAAAPPAAVEEPPAA